MVLGVKGTVDMRIEHKVKILKPVNTFSFLTFHMLQN